METALLARLRHRTFNPATLFLAGEKGAWYDASDLTTLFQDSAGTTPVTAAGQPVGKWLDKSGLGFHATQATSSKRPTYQSSGGLSWLSFDGVDDALATAAIDFTATDKMSVFAGVRKLSDAATALVAEFTTNSSKPGSFYLAGPLNGTHKGFGAASTGTLGRAVFATNASLVAPVTVVSSANLDISAPLVRLSFTNGYTVSSVLSQGVGNYANDVLYIGGRAATSLYFTGNIYGLIVRGAASTDTETALAERWLANKAGITL